MEIRHSHVQLEGIPYHYAEAGEGPLVLLIHGFPELWYSWRQQLPALASAGYRAVAPDLRGFGQSHVPDGVEAYGLLRHTSDVRALISALGAREAVLVGHDWGANLAWALALQHPDVVRAVVGLSIPFYPEPRDPAEIRRFSPGRFNFLEYFQRPGAAEREFAQSPRRFLQAFLFGLSGDAPAGTVDRLYLQKPAEASLLEGFPEPRALPAWLSEGDLDYYVAAFERSGISGALGFYRSMDRDYAELRQIYQRPFAQPAFFIGGGLEASVRFGSLEPMQRAIHKLRGALIVQGCGHWLQQERPELINCALLQFLREGLD
ncbi:MAG: alpha/beta hydrolase [Deltaproteobacteria bacterium]